MRALTELKKECISRLGDPPYYDVDSCFVCGESRPKRLTIHHHCYDKQSVTYNQFENSDDGRLKYYANLLDEIKNNKNNFTVLCINCHNELEESLQKFLKEKTRCIHDDYRLDLVFNMTIESRQEKEKTLSQAMTGLDEFFWSK